MTSPIPVDPSSGSNAVLSDSQEAWSNRLYNAACLGDVEGVKRASAREGKLNNRYGDALETPLIAAIRRGRTEVVECLLHLGADPNVTNAQGHNAVYAAGMVQRHAMMRLALEYGGDPDVYGILNGKAHDTILHRLVSRNDFLGVKMLLEAGADPLAPDASGNIPRKIVTPDLADTNMLLALRHFEELPQVPQTGRLTKAMLFASEQPDAPCMLDNPRTWRQWPRVVERLKANGEKNPLPLKEELMQEGRNGEPYLAVAAQACSLRHAVAMLNGLGQSVLLDEFPRVPQTKWMYESRHVARAILHPHNLAGIPVTRVALNQGMFSSAARAAVISHGQGALRAGGHSSGGIGRGR